MKLVRTALLACSMGAAAAAHADVTFAFGVTAENLNAGLYNYQYPDPQTSGVLSTGGPLVVQSGGVSAMVNAWADARTGVFKSIASVDISTGGRPIDIAEAYARLDVRDVLVFNGTGATATAEFRMSYDTQLSGLGFGAFPRDGQLSHFQQVWSFRQMTMSYDVANPSYDPNATCTGDGEGTFCPPETQQFITVQRSLNNEQFREVALGGPDGIYTNGDATNGRYTGTEVLSFEVPVGVEVRLSYTVYNMVRCFHMNACALTSDASHSDYLGLVAPQGFSSASGYEYQGLAAAVPEPATAWMSLAGLGLLAGAWRRRHQA